jgi:hypothetical protein
MQQQTFVPVFPSVKDFVNHLNQFVKMLIKNGLPYELVLPIFEQVKQNFLKQFLSEINARTVSAAGSSRNLEFGIMRARNRAVTFDCIRAILELTISDRCVVYLPETFKTSDTQFLSRITYDDECGHNIHFIDGMFKTMNLSGIREQHGRDHIVVARTIFVNANP